MPKKTYNSLYVAHTRSTSVWVVEMKRLKKFKVMQKHRGGGTFITTWGSFKHYASKYAFEVTRVETLQDAIEICDEILCHAVDAERELY